ncbi:MAG: hypothetical protein E7073_00490 [Bacteroidales bacterium]|nr:hypothetical protein [Bacteroidales bacterium]
MKGTTLSSIRRVAITLLVMLFTTASAWAQFPTPTIYRLSLNANYQGGALGMVDVPISEPTTTYTLTQNDEPTREGYTFCGWSTSSTGNIQYRTNDQIPLTGNLTLYAVWDDNPYTLTLNTSYDGGVVKSILVPSIDPNYTLTSDDEPTRIGYIFAGWSTSSTGAIQYRTNDKITLTGNLTLYAVWDDNPYTLTLNSSYDGGDVKSILVPSIDPSYTLTSDDEPTRTGYTFYGWSESPTGTVEYRTNDKIALAGNLTLYAIWGNVILKYTITDEDKRQAEVSGYEGDESVGALFVPATTIINGIEYSVTSIGNNAFDFFRSLQSVTITESVTSIGSSAFSYCTSLQSVTIPESVTSIGSNAFFYCTSLQSVTIPESVTSIGGRAFENCSSLQSVTINGNPDIVGSAFDDTPATVTMNLTASQIDGDYWTTFYNKGYNFQADENTTVYKATVNGSSLMLTEVEDKIVNSGTAVILKSSGNPVMTLTKSGSSDTNGNDLRGISNRQYLDVVKIWFGANTIYTMGNTSAGFGFHRYTGEFVPAGEAFLPLYIDDEATAQSITLVSPCVSSTGIKPVSSDKDLQKHWFTISGARLGGKPSHPGVYINGNKKVMIK